MSVFWRKQLGFLITLAMICGSLVPAAQAASAPNIFTYQGRVLNANGVPVSDASLSMKFFLYSASSGGTCLWSNSSANCDLNTPASTTARTVSLTTGLFTQNLGDTGDTFAAIADSVFGDNATVYLEVIIAGETLIPRRQITAAPYALNADTLDGIDSAALQLFETGSGRTFEDDAPVIIGTNAALTYGSGGVGDLRVEDELEVMGDGYIDNDLVVGASTSSTETITNAGFSLAGDDLFVAGSLGIETAVYLDGIMNVATSQADTDAVEVSFTLGNDADVDTVNALEILVTSTATGDADILHGLSVGDLSSAQAGVTETGIAIGSGWDYNLSFADATAVIAITNTGSLVVNDGTNTLFTIEDQGSISQVTVAGNLFTTEDITVQGDNLDSDGGPLVINVNAGDEVRIGSGIPSVATGASDLYVGDALEVDGAIDVRGSQSITDFGGTSTNTSISVQPTFSGTLSAQRNDYGTYSLSSSSVDRNGNTYGVSGFTGAGQFTGISAGPSELMGVYGVGVLTSTASTSPLVEGLKGEVTSTTSGGTITDARAVYGNIGIGSGAITTAYGGYLASTASGSTSRYGLFAKASTDNGGNTGTLYGVDAIASDGLGGNATTAYGLRASASGATTTNISGYFYDARVQIDDDSTLNTPAVATGAGDLFVVGDIESDANLDIGGTLTVADITCADCLDFTELSDTLALDTSTSIALDGSELLTFTNSGTGNLVFNSTSTGDVALQSGGTDFFVFDADRSLEYTTNQTTTDPFDFIADSLTTAIGLDMSLDALTTGEGVNVASTSAALSSGRLVDVDHTATYSATTALSGNGLRVNRALTMSGAGNTLTVSGDLVNIANSGTQTAGTLTDTSDVLGIEQNYATASGDVIEVLNAGTGRGVFIDQNGNGNSLVIDSESTSTNVVDIDGSTTTSGQLIQIVGGDFTDDTGRAIFLDVTESTSTADLVMIQTNVGSSNNNVFRIEADGEVFSDVGFTAGAFSTNYMDGEIQTTSDMLLDIDGGDLTFDQATILGDGGDALTINSSGTLTVNDATIAGSGALTLQSAAAGALFLDAASGLVSTTAGDDFSVGANSLVSAFSVDESANIVRVGDAAGTNGEIDMYASNGSWGDITWDTGDYLNVGGGALQVSNFMDLTDAYGVNAETVINAGVSPSRTLVANGNEYGAHITIDSGTDKGANVFNLRAVNGTAVFTSDTVTGPTEVAGVYGYGRLQSNAQTAPAVAGVQGEVNSATAGGTITQAIGVAGKVVTGSGTITNGYGGTFSNTSAGTNRYGLLASASGGTANFSGYFHSARVQIDADSTPNSPSVATGSGDLYVVDAIEADGALDIGGTATVVDLVCTDCLDFTELTDTLALDASTSIAMDGAETLTVTNGSSANAIVNLTSTGDFVVQDAASNVLSVLDTGVVQIDGRSTSVNSLTLTSLIETGTLIDVGYATATTQSSAVKGLDIDLATNLQMIDNTNQTGVGIDLDGLVANVAGSSTSVTGYEVSGGALDSANNGTAETIQWYGLDIALPNVDTGNASDVTSATGIRIQPGTLTDGLGSEEYIGLDMTGTRIDLDADNNTSFISSTDNQIDWEIGGIAQTLIMRDPLGADDASSAVNSILEINYATPVDTTGTNIHAGMVLDIDVGNASGGTNQIYGIEVEAMIGDPQVTQLNAIRVDALTGSASTGETALNIADGWDASIYLEGSAPNFWIGNGARLAFQDASGNDIAILRDVSAVGNHTILIDSDTAFMLDSSADTDVDITTLLDEMLFVRPQGTGDTRFGTDADSVVEVVASAAPGVDMFTITNAGQAVTTNVNALQITHEASNITTDAVNILPAFAGGATDGLVYQGLNIAAFSPTNGAGIDTIAGINVAPVTDPGATISSYGLVIGSGWDSNLYFKDTTVGIQIEDGGDIKIQDSAGNALFSIKDSGTTGQGSIRSLFGPNNSALSVTGGTATVVGDAGEDLELTGGVNSGAGSGGSGGKGILRGGAAAGDGTVARDGGDVTIESGASTIGAGNAGNIKIIGGDSTAGQNGNIDLQSGGSPTAITVNGGDIAMSSDDDFFLSSDDDVTMDVTSAAALVNLFDSAFAKTIDIGSVDTDSADTVRIATNVTTADTVTIGNTNATSTVAIFGGNDWEVTTNGLLSIDLSDGNASTEAVCGTDGAEDSAFSRLDDCTAAVNADYAERYPAAADVEYGDIVVPGETVVYTEDPSVGRQAIRQAVKSSYAYQGPVIGIASNNYGDFTSAGGNVAEADNPMPIALVGRVPVKVTDEGGSISAGDYLTTSSTAGKAMKATKVGRVIGMALEDWDGASATVMVQVNNSWSMGDVLGTDGTSTLVTDNVIVSSVETASVEEPSFDSYGLALRGSAWNGSEAEAVEMMLQNVVDDQDNYRLSIRNTSEAEVAYITNEGTMRIAGDMVIGGRLYPSDRGTPQTDKYIYYDGSAGAGGDFMRTNAKGWSTGSYDFAEMFPSDEALTSGDVVVFTGTGESVQRATGADGEQLSGIVSTRPGFLAGENVEGAYPIALAGRVPTKVNLSNGAIAVGDPLTASVVSGEAMKATEAGQIVGYALEAYVGTESDNLILAYVNVGYWSGEAQTITIAENSASEVSPSGTQNYTALNMSGNIFMATNQILSIGRLEGVSALWSIESDGTIKTEGSIKTVTMSYQGTKVETVAVTSPESVITLTGTSTLVDGRAEVRFEDVVPEFNDVISAIAPIRVIVTPSGPVSLYISEKDQNHFIVERFVGSADVEFDWMVTGYRKGFEPEEEEEVAEEEEEQTDVIPSETSEVSGAEESAGDETDTEQVVEEEPAVEEESASPESPDEPLIDSATEGEGGASAEPTDVVIEPSSTQP